MTFQHVQHPLQPGSPANAQVHRDVLGGGPVDPEVLDPVPEPFSPSVDAEPQVQERPAQAESEPPAPEPAATRPAKPSRKRAPRPRR